MERDVVYKIPEVQNANGRVVENKGGKKNKTKQQTKKTHNTKRVLLRSQKLV